MLQLMCGMYAIIKRFFALDFAICRAKQSPHRGWPRLTKDLRTIQKGATHSPWFIFFFFRPRFSVRVAGAAARD